MDLCTACAIGWPNLTQDAKLRLQGFEREVGNVAAHVSQNQTDMVREALGGQMFPYAIFLLGCHKLVQGILWKSYDNLAINSSKMLGLGSKF